MQMFKGGLISERFSLWPQSPKKVFTHSPEQLLSRWIVLIALILHLFVGDGG